MPDTTQIEILEHAEDLLKEYAKTIEILERERKRQLTDDEAKEVDGPELRVFPGELEDVWKELRELKAEGHQLDSPTIYDFLGPYVLMCDRSKVLWADEPKPKSPEWWGDFLEFRDEMKLEDERRKRYGEPYYGSNMPLSRTERNKPAASNSPG